MSAPTYAELQVGCMLYVAGDESGVMEFASLLGPNRGGALWRQSINDWHSKLSQQSFEDWLWEISGIFELRSRRLFSLQAQPQSPPAWATEDMLTYPSIIELDWRGKVLDTWTSVVFRLPAQAPGR